MLLVFGCDSMLCLLLHRLHKVLHVLEGIDLQSDVDSMNVRVKYSITREKAIHWKYRYSWEPKQTLIFPSMPFNRLHLYGVTLLYMTE